MRILSAFALASVAVVGQSLETIQYLDSSLKPAAINNANLVVGSAGTSAFRLVSASGAITQFTYPGALSTAAGGINNFDQIVGSYTDSHSHCFLRQSSGSIASFDAPGATDTWCTAINDTGQIVGYYKDAQGAIHGFLRDGGTTTTLDYPGGLNTKATGINNAGEIAGVYDSNTAPPGAVAWTAGFRRKANGTYTTFAYDQSTGVGQINNLGQIAVTSYHLCCSPIFLGNRGFIVDSSGNSTATLTGGCCGGNSTAVAVNDNGVTLASLVGKFYVTIACPVNVSPSTLPALNGGGQSLDFSITAPASCGYLTKFDASWIHLPNSSTVTNSVYGPGNSTFTVAVDVNPNSGSRTGSFKIGGQTISLTQGSALVCPPVLANSNVSLSASFPSTPTGTRVYATNGCNWNATSDSNWLTIAAGSSGGGTGDLVVSGAPIQSSTITSRTGHITVGSQTLTVTQSVSSSCYPDFGESTSYVDPNGGNGAFQMTLPSDCSWTANPPSWITLTSPVSGAGSATIRFATSANPTIADRYDAIRFDFGGINQIYHWIRQPVIGGLQGQRFIPITPCRIADTRSGSGYTGLFGAPALATDSKRTIPVRQSNCGIPDSATAYSLNVTVVPYQPLSYVTAWPTGSSQPFTSVLNSPAGVVVANAALVQGGTNGSVDFYTTDKTDLVLDVNGYFVSANNPQALAYYPINPCRIADTRPGSGFTGPFGAPVFPGGGSTRTIPVQSSQCGIPATAKAYALNVTAVPTGPLSYITAWPAGKPQPFVSTLNSPEGRIVANAAIVPAGDSGDINVYALLAPNATAGLVLDITGYFAPPNGPNPLSFYPTVPCRLTDTRLPDAAPPLSGGSATRIISPGASSCTGFYNVYAYALNATVVPLNGALGYLTLWPYGSAQPFASTLNSMDGRIVSNAAIIPSERYYPYRFLAYGLSDAGKGADLIIDMWGYFAP